MQRLAITLSAFALIFAMLVNITLFYQNTQLRRRIAAPPAAAALSPDQTARLAEIQRQLEQADQARAKALGEATALRGQIDQLKAAAQERDTLRGQLQSAQQEAEQLRAQIGNLQTMNTVNGQVTPLRGLAPLKNVPRSFMNREQLRSYFTELLDREWPPEEEDRQQAILQALDMAGAGANLRASQIDSAVKSILGFYDQRSKQLVIISSRANMGVRDRVTYAHEFTHSLQDQHYDLTALFARAEGNSDYELALKALVEGDATLTMGLYAEQHLTAMDIANYQLESVRDFDLSGLLLGGGGGPLVESALYFPYRDGARFVATLYATNGWRAVNAAFAQPPRSTEQVLHPERYYAGDEPQALRLPPAPAGWRALAEDTLGELYLRIYLEHQLPIEVAIPACEGWGGDRYQVLRDEQGRLALRLQTAWDDLVAAQRFYDAMAAYATALGGGAPAVIEAGVDHLRWQLAGRQFYVGRAGSRVLVLHAPDAATLDALLAAR